VLEALERAVRDVGLIRYIPEKPSMILNISCTKVTFVVKMARREELELV
jgi:hypothetical protein